VAHETLGVIRVLTSPMFAEPRAAASSLPSLGRERGLR
jgi:hypothetical protein